MYKAEFSLWQLMINWLFPPLCIACRVMLPLNMGNFYICGRCEPLFERVLPPFCKKCGSKLNAPEEICASCFGKKLFFESNESGFLYDELMRDMLHDMKFRNKKRIAEGLGALWAKTISLPRGDFVLVPLPMHHKKRKERGFNQAEVLAKALAKECKAGYVPLLKRIVDTPAQSGLHPKQREENVKNAFKLLSGYSVLGKTVVLIDDIYTTGASLNECARVLTEAGAAVVLAKTLALTVYRHQQPTDEDDGA